MPSEPSIKLVKSAIRTIELFEVFAKRRQPLTLVELAQALAAPKSSCHELVQTLAHLGYILVIDGGKRYYPSRRFWETAEQINQFNPVKEKIQSQLRGLRNDTGETVFIGRLQGQKVVYTEVFDGSHTIRYSAQSGDVKSLHASALGKALLGALPQAERDQLISNTRLTRFNANTITAKTRLREHLDEAQRSGVFITRGEQEADVIGVAVPVVVQGYLLAIGLAGPATRMEKQLKAYIAALKRVAAEIQQ